MDEKDFELLEVLDETRNITHAADKLYMTQSALSKRIKSMEQELGVEILLRSRQGIRFTPAGEKVLEHSRAALKQMEQLRRGLDAMQGEVCGTLKAGVSVNFSYYRLSEVLAEYQSIPVSGWILPPGTAATFTSRCWTVRWTLRCCGASTPGTARSSSSRKRISA